jgi:hypothetical protein
MGLSLSMKFDDGDLADKDTINNYYDFMADKERNYSSDIRDQGSGADQYRQYALNRAEERDDDTAMIFEWWPSSLRNTEIRIRDLADPDAVEPVIYGEDIRTFIGHLRKGKEDLKQQDDAVFWEYFFELRLITLCEFALEHGYGVELS